MNSILILSCGAIISFFSFTCKKSKGIHYLILVYFLFIYTFCNGGVSDLEIYKITYKDHLYVTAPGFDFLMRLFAAGGFQFVVFKGFCGLVTIGFLSKAINKCTYYSNVSLALCMIFPILSAVSQIRNGMMMAIVIYAIVSYICDTHHNVIRYIIWILIASLIHPVALIYLIFIFARKRFGPMQISRFISILCLVSLVELIIAKDLAYGIAKIFIKNEKYLVYFNFSAIMSKLTEKTLNIKGKLLPFFGQLLGYLSFKYLKRNYLSNYLRADEYVIKQVEKKKRRIFLFNRDQLTMADNMLLLSFIIIPFYQFNPTYFRIFKNITPLIYIVMAQNLYLDTHTSVIPKKILPVSKTFMVILFTALCGTFLTAYSQGGFLEILNSFSI
jgi:hypothetical protein